MNDEVRYESILLKKGNVLVARTTLTGDLSDVVRNERNNRILELLSKCEWQISGLKDYEFISQTDSKNTDGLI